MDTKPEEQQAESRRRRLVLVPCPFQGHINPMLQLAKILHHRGFSITIAHTIFNSPNPLNHPEFTFLAIPDNVPSHKTSFEDAVSAILLVNADCGDPLRDILEKMEGRDELVCVIFDEMMYYVESVAESLKIPSIMLRTNNAATLVARLTLIKFNEEGRVPIPIPDSMMEEPVPELHHLRFKDLPYPMNTEAAGNFWDMINNMSNIKKASAFIINTIDYLEPEELIQLKQIRRVPIFPIGPLHKLVPPIASSSTSSLIEEDSSCLQWLDRQETISVLYVSLGSIASMHESELPEMAWGLFNSNRPFLWVIRPESEEISLPEGSKGKIIRWAPQKEVLAHKAVGAFWSHGGWNSTLESLGEGVPMICRPHYGDQLVDARYVTQVWKVGLTYESDRLERGEVERITRRIMVGKEGEEMRKRAKELKEKLEASVANQGSSYGHFNQFVELIKSF